MTDADLQNFSSELKRAADAARALAQEHSNLLSSSTRAQQGASDAADDLADTLQDAAKQTKNMTDRQKVMAAELAKLRKREKEAVEQVTKVAKELDNAVQQFGVSSREATDLQNKLNEANAEEIAAKSATQGASNDLNLSLKRSAKSAKLASIALDWFGTSVKTQGKQLIEQYKQAGGVVEGSGGLFSSLYQQQQDAFKMGLTGADLQKMVNANRQVVNAMGGTESAVNELNPAIKRFRILTGSSAEAAKLAGEAATDFAKKGIAPNARVLESYTNDMVEMRRRTGESYEDIHKMFSEVASESDSIAILRAARADEREAILASQRALIQQSIAVGMSTEQAKNAAKMLNKMAGAKPLDRLRQAAKIRALGGAMGVAGAEEAAQAVIAGKRMTDEQRANLNKFSQDMATTMDTMARQGLGSEIFGSVLLEKLDLEQYYGPTSEFSTSLGTALTPVIGVLEEIRDVSKTPEGKAIGAAILKLEQATLLMSGQNALGLAISGLAASVGILAMVMQGKKFLGTMGGWGTRGASGGGGPGKGGKLGRAASIGKSVVGKGGAGALFSLAGEYGGSVLEEAGYEKTGAGVKVLGSAATGATMGSLLGPAGAAVGGVLGAGYGLYQNWDGLTGGEKETEMKPISQKQQRELSQESADEEIKLATLSMADGMTKQILQMDTSNVLLKQLSDNSTKQIELSEKQLIALTLTEREKTDSANRTNLRRDNKFGASYNYV